MTFAGHNLCNFLADNNIIVFYVIFKAATTAFFQRDDLLSLRMHSQAHWFAPQINFLSHALENFSHVCAVLHQMNVECNQWN